MSFISLEFLLFFPAVVLLFYFAPHKFRWVILLFASCLFYMAFIPKYILILFFTIIIDYFAAIQIERSHARRRKTWLIVSIISNVGILAVLKYYNFFIDNLNLANTFPVLRIALPIGLSFHTFQAMAYIIEVYRGNQQPEKHFGIYALYIMFFPQLVAGPIERPQHVLHQFHEKKIFNYNNATSGLRLILWGFFKKMVIADRLAIFTDQVYNSPAGYSAWTLTAATFFFAFQIYCDFSAYSDIAIGTARVMGFTLMRNFDFPYQSRSLAEFWKRWHISLSSWFRDYIYIPLGGNHVKFSRWCFNLLFVFVLSGFWHGANWTFIFWGALNGLYILLEKITSKYRLYATRFLHLEKSIFIYWLQVITCFLLIMESWVFFRAKSLQDALLIFYRQKSLLPDLFHALVNRKNLFNIDIGTNWIILNFLLIVGLLLSEYIVRKKPFRGFYLPASRFSRWAIYYTLMASLLLMGVFGKNVFIYFQF